MNEHDPHSASEDVLYSDVSRLVGGARDSIARTVNSTLAMLHWEIGARIRKDVLGLERAEYGQGIIARIAERLTTEYGRGWSRRNLFSMVQFAEVYPDRQIVQSLIAQLSWTHFLVLMTLEDVDEREFYTLAAVREGWSVRTLREQMRTALFRRLALSRESDSPVFAGNQAHDGHDIPSLESTFKDPYVLDFLGLPYEHSEKELERAILDDIERFLLELGSQFCFVARQKRMRVGSTDYVLDLLFFHRGLRRLVAIELKTGALRPEHKGQMQLYLGWLDRFERGSNELSPVGLILCTKKCPDLVELLGMDDEDIYVSTYLTQRLPTQALQRRVLALLNRYALEGSSRRS